ncbi:hypothetical protein SDJN02_19720, partial [Cucurbita argyrosperma subsp. argyrosperma]
MGFVRILEPKKWRWQSWDGAMMGCLLVPLAMTNCMSLDVDLNGGRKNFAHYELWISHICLILFTTNSMSMDEGTARSWIHLEDT